MWKFGDYYPHLLAFALSESQKMNYLELLYQVLGFWGNGGLG